MCRQLFGEFGCDREARDRGSQRWTRGSREAFFLLCQWNVYMPLKGLIKSAGNLRVVDGLRCRAGGGGGARHLGREGLFCLGGEEEGGQTTRGLETAG